MKKIVAICVSATKIRYGIIDTFPKKKNMHQMKYTEKLESISMKAARLLQIVI